MKNNVEVMNYLKQIKFFYQISNFQVRQSSLVKKWIYQTIRAEKAKLALLEFVFCSDDYLLTLNQKYLNHNTFTDIITFPMENAPFVGGTIYISIERVRDNAKIYKQTFKDELHRVIIHGVLHLCGYNDYSNDERKQMAQLEDKYLLLRSKMFHVEQ